MTYQEALDYMQGLHRFGIKLGNERFEALLDYSQKSVLDPSIHDCDPIAPQGLQKRGPKCSIRPEHKRRNTDDY